LMQRFGDPLERELRNAVGGDRLLLYDMVRYHMGWVDERGMESRSDPGKRLRPLLCLLACEAVSGDFRQALCAAAALELVHNFTLVHDDVMDGDRERRHRPTVWAIWGKSQAINAGDLLYSRGIESMAALAASGLAAEQALTAVRRLEQTCVEVIEGQFLDLEFEGRSDVGVDEYLVMIGKKSAALIACSLEIGALAGGAGPQAQRAFSAAGREMGLAFQIRDDMLGIWGDASVTGKPVGADVRRKKKTLPAIRAFELAGGEDLRGLRAIYSTPRPSGAQVATVLEIMKSLGVWEDVGRLAAEHAAAAAAALDALPVPEERRRAILGVLEFFVRRDA